MIEKHSASVSEVRLLRMFACVWDNWYVHVRVGPTCDHWCVYVCLVSSMYVCTIALVEVRTVQEPIKINPILNVFLF